MSISYNLICCFSGYYDRPAGSPTSLSAQKRTPPLSAKARWPPTSSQNPMTLMLIGGTIHLVNQTLVCVVCLSYLYLSLFSLWPYQKQRIENNQGQTCKGNIYSYLSFGKVCKHLRKGNLAKPDRIARSLE